MDQPEVATAQNRKGEMLKTKEVARILGVSPRTIQAWLQEGKKFPNAYKAGGGQTSPWLIPEKDVQALQSASPVAVVIEDDYDAGEIAEIALDRVGFITRVCGSAKEAKTFLEAEPDLLILDLALPGEQGEEVLEWMEKKDIDLPVIVLSAFEDRASETKDHPLVVQVLRKPLPFSTLGQRALTAANQEEQ
jgi:CheY-like chemotaxis protein